MPLAGQILRHKNFVFTDSNVGEKLLVVLNTCENNQTCLVLKTTSQSKHYPYATPGCNSSKKAYCIYKECEQDFPQDTFVQLDSVYPVNVEEQLQVKQVTFTGHLDLTPENSYTLT